MVTAIVGKEHYKAQLIATGHQLIADEPEDAGGGNFGPSPHEYLQMALASCTAITVRMYADRKNFKLDKVRVEVDITRFPEKVLLKRDVYFEGELTEEQRTRLLQIANSCPVHKTLTHPIEIETSLKNDLITS